MRCLALITCLYLSTVAAAAAPEPPDRPLTLDDCLALARLHNPSLVIAQQGVVSAQAGVRRAASAYLPAAALTAAHGRTGGSSFVETPAGTIAFSTSGRRREAEVLLSQTVWQTGRRQQVGAARLSLAASRERESQALQDLMLSVSQLYYQALASEELVAVAQATLEAARHHEELVRARAAVGEAAPVDLMPAAAEVAEAEYGLLQAENGAALDRARLKKEIGLPPTYDLRLASPAEAPAAEAPPALAEALQSAAARRPELAALRHALAATEESLRLTRALERGVIALSAQYERGLAGPREGTSWAAVLSATTYLFDGGARRAEVDSARAELESLRAQRREALNAIGLEVESALLEADTARKSVEAATKAVASAEAQLAAAEGKYREGVGVFVEVLDAQRTLTRARTNLVQAQYRHQTSLVALRKATGELASGGDEPQP